MKRDRYPHQQLENWDKALDRALKNLPEQTAPVNLIAHVMSQVNARIEEKWYQRLWWRWPLWLRATLSILLLALTVWLPSLGSQYYETNMVPSLNRSINVCQTAFSLVASTLGRSPFGFDGEVGRIVFLTASLLLLVMYLTCIGVGTIIYRTVRR